MQGEKTFRMLCIASMLLASIQKVSADAEVCEPPPVSSIGQEVARAMTARYNDTRTNCGQSSAPSFLCTGVMLRGTSSSKDFDTWNPSPDTIARGGGVSFSFMRQDALVVNLYKPKGIVMYPVLSAPADRFKVQYLCAYPVDGATSNRDQEGCGAHRQHLGSGPCAEQGILTAEQFAEHYVREPRITYLHQRQCSFNIRDSENNRAGTAFAEMIRAMAMIPHISANDQNEVIAQYWGATATSAQLPFEAIFYTSDNGLEGAQDDQIRYRYQTGIVLPIIKITLPVRGGAQAQFEFIESAQAVVR